MRELLGRKEMRFIDNANTALVLQAIGKFQMEHGECHES